MNRKRIQLLSQNSSYQIQERTIKNLSDKLERLYI